eukprot:scaffold172930_cov17-Tisochrysis_lutea.AAC.1
MAGVQLASQQGQANKEYPKCSPHAGVRQHFTFAALSIMLEFDIILTLAVGNHLQGWKSPALAA